MTGVNVSLPEQPDMTLSTFNQDHIGMAFEPPAVYVPPRLHDTHLVYLHTVLPLPDGAEVDYLLNGGPGPVEGISVVLHPAVNGVLVNHAFLQSYRGPWPALLEVRYLKNGQPADLGRLPLLDPDAAVATRLQVDVLNSPVVIPSTGATEVVTIRPRLFDAELIPLPRGFGTVIELLDPHDGIRQYDGSFIVTDAAVAGEYRVRVTTRWGLEQTVSFTVASTPE